MKDIKCGLTNCKFNRGYCCCAKGICVSGNTDCKTFSMWRDKTQNEFASDFIKADYSVDTTVSCSADCLFNKDGKCISNGITVTSEGNSIASCLTFVKK